MSDDLVQDTADDLLLVQGKMAQVTDPEASDALNAVHQCLSSIHRRLFRVEARLGLYDGRKLMRWAHAPGYDR